MLIDARELGPKREIEVKLTEADDGKIGGDMNAGILGDLPDTDRQLLGCRNHGRHVAEISIHTGERWVVAFADFLEEYRMQIAHGHFLHKRITSIDHPITWCGETQVADALMPQLHEVIEGGGHGLMLGRSHVDGVSSIRQFEVKRDHGNLPGADAGEIVGRGAIRERPADDALHAKSHQVLQELQFGDVAARIIVGL